MQINYFLVIEGKKQTIMETITIEYDGRNKAIKALISALLKFEDVREVSENKSYDPEMVCKIKRGQEAFQKGNYKIIGTADLWK